MVIRFTPVLRVGLFLWSLGAGLRLLFNRHTHVVIYAVVLAVEGAGVGFTHQPGNNPVIGIMIKNSFNFELGLVAVQALARSEDRAVATSTRNVLRSLGSVFGVAISTAAQRASMQSALHDGGSPNIHYEELSNSSTSGKISSALEKSRILDAKMAGFRTVFVSLVPLVSLCFVGNFLVINVTLSDSAKGKEKPIEGTFKIPLLSLQLLPPTTYRRVDSC